ncbi:MAG: carboxypeptidase-like regulatory domain-containing protein [Armatimonadota bacterium]
MAARKAVYLLLAAAIVATALLFGGCEGAGPQGGAPPPAGATATIEGTVVSASDSTTPVSGAIVTVRGRGAQRQSTTSGPNGAFQLTNVTPGIVVLDVAVPVTGAFHDSSIRVQGVAGRSTHVIIALVPAGFGRPNSLAIAPRDVTMQTGVTRDFNAEVRDATGAQIPAQASWALVGDILNPNEQPENHIDDDNNGVVDDGTIDRFGRYTAIKTTTPRTGQVFASSGTASDAVDVVVNPPGPPILSQFVVTPTSLRPDGGTILISAEAEDGDGIGDAGTPPANILLPPVVPGSLVPPYDGVADLIANIQLRGSATVNQILVPLKTGTNKLGYYEASYVVPANSNPTLPDGTQPEQVYDIHLTGIDVLGATTNSPVLSVVVEGVQPPPPPP